MTTAPTPIADDTDRTLIGFAETSAADCRCRHCTAAARRESAREPARDSAREVSGGRIHRAVRSTCLATTVLAGAGVAGLGLGAGTAHAAPAPAKPGWDGSVYWFKNASGQWRYTSHYSVYAARAGAANSAPAATTTAGGGTRQGWDGSVYWFKNASGQWRYTSHYDIYAARTGGGTPAPAPAPPTPSAAGGYESAVGYALAQLGKPYVWGGNGPNGFDCSGLVQQAYRRSGISLPRVADDQYRATTPISSGQLRRGDLLFWSGNGRASGIHHVAIYLGDGTYLEAPKPGKNVRISRLNSGYHPDFLGRP